MTVDDSSAPPQKVYLVSIHPVADYDAWKRDTDGRVSELAGSGAMRHWILRGVDDSKEVMVVIEVSSRQEAESLLMSSTVGDWLERMDIEIYPTFFLGQLMETQQHLDRRPADPAGG